MNKTLFHLIIMAAILTVSCTKRETAIESNHFNNRLIPIGSESGSKTQNYLMAFQAGHTAEGCSGCVTILGVRCHVDCMSYGHLCTRTASVSLNQKGTDITVTTIDTFDLTSEDFFLMPARSLYYYTEDNNNIVYLNIPEQMVYRDTATLQFTFTGLFLTNVPEYNND